MKQDQATSPDVEDGEGTAPPRVTDAPADIWLVYGELEHDDTHWNCCRVGDVSWCEDKQNNSDVHYVRGDRYDDLCAEIERLRKKLAESCAEHRSEIYDTATGGGCILLHDAVVAERERCSVLTDDMLRYAMAALGTGNPQEAARFRAFWLHAMTARHTKA